MLQTSLLEKGRPCAFFQQERNFHIFYMLCYYRHEGGCHGDEGEDTDTSDAQDMLGDKAYNERLARARAQAVAAQMIHDGYPGKNITIVADPEAFGNMSLGKENASEIDRKVTIFYAR